MALDSYFPFASTFLNTTTVYLQADGLERTNVQNPSGLLTNLKIENGMLVSTMRDIDEFTYFGHRADISWPPNTRAEYWYTWKIMIPSSWGDYSKRIVVAQIHDRADGGDSQQFPNFLLLVDNKEFTVIVPEGLYPTPINVGISKGGFPLVFNQWYDCCLHANWQISGGFREFFIDRIPVFKEYGVATEYDNVLGPYLKLGLYDGDHGGDFGTKTACYRDVRIWSGNDGYQTVMDGVPRLPTAHLKL